MLIAASARLPMAHALDRRALGVTMAPIGSTQDVPISTMRSIKSIGTVLLLALLAGGCGSTTVSTRTTTVSVGQQLIDLQNAYKSGSMTKDQYEKAKEQLIDKVLD
jgi:hypothetical protein